ncbi:GCN5-related N-acetyltransferase [Catenulispora acidiphila DSM 44928]|uniref:GCN5-related N-acetyltransferase n=1 Tax=Catenulispora acidiphila (strain DSM 44928 / JCM 14897 / NBRC 102108 / NRRL B-24433 / ID139908) TaxID=479433 RepID=C7QH37_CATAD|nr:GNAT family N-acetyltransferase [Catenulispora acidiphila]ACU76887.1 GCN5-related N-acetyltransferase [Catenulispora acidiphila DSM 44928]
MALTFQTYAEIPDSLRARLVDIWTDATNAGGAIGFVAPVERETVDAAAFGNFAVGRDLFLVGFEDGEPAAFLVVVDHQFALKSHARLLKTVVVHPKHQGKGYGVELMRAAEDVARTLDGVEMLHLTCRGGLGLEHFYSKCGYTEVGRIPRMLRVSADDYRDEIYFALSL